MDRDQENAPRRPEPKGPEPAQPADVIRDGNLKASIWRNESEGGAFYATTFTRTYRDQEGAYRDSNSFVAADLLRLSELARTAYARTNDLRRDDRGQADNADAGRDAFRTQRSQGRPRASREYDK